MLVLSSWARPGGKWGPPEYVHNFTFTAGTILALTAKAEYGHFSLIANGLQVYLQLQSWTSSGVCETFAIQ